MFSSRSQRKLRGRGFPAVSMPPDIQKAAVSLQQPSHIALCDTAASGMDFI
ncbi:hypothetical protein HMPREF1986_01425 [Oribacterium sp. oral taxon 078 str. F0263]|nr:hypothetical protein HMPREF1986_01425 [Oribacterium sp. oral taxon 078 str. F0263]